jgi:hypothetical protein
MPREQYPPEEIIQHLRTVELKTGNGIAGRDACRKLRSPNNPFIGEKKEYGGLSVDPTTRLKALE